MVVVRHITSFEVSSMQMFIDCTYNLQAHAVALLGTLCSFPLVNDRDLIKPPHPRRMQNELSRLFRGVCMPIYWLIPQQLPSKPSMHKQSLCWQPPHPTPPAPHPALPEQPYQSSVHDEPLSKQVEMVMAPQPATAVSGTASRSLGKLLT